MTDPEQVGRLARVGARIDDRVCDVIEHGSKERFYFQRTSLPNQPVGLGKVIGPRYVPINSPVQSDLLKIARADLRPAPAQAKTPRGAAQSRLDFETALTHRPGQGDATRL